MSEFGNALRIIPRTAWIVAVAVYVLLVALISVLINQPLAPIQWIILLGIAPVFLSAYVLLVGYVAADTKRRGMRSGLWIFLAIAVPNGIGAILYFILREPVMRACAQCGAPVRSGFAYCPLCGSAAARVCASCGRALEPGWAVCPYCGQKA